MTDYDYAQLELMARAGLDDLKGRLLTKFLVHVVEPEFNVAILVTDAGTWEICGRIGGEVLGIAGPTSTREKGGTNGQSLRRYAAFLRFEGRRIEQARTIGQAWNGHGFEITFEGLPDETMLIQSIYSSPKPDGLEDCLRLGIGMYVSSTEGTG